VQYQNGLGVLIANAYLRLRLSGVETGLGAINSLGSLAAIVSLAAMKLIFTIPKK
jgi:hypothetical protein